MRDPSKIATLAIVATLTCCVLSFALQDRNDKLNRLHPRYVQNCVLGTDEPIEECESRWQKALKP